MKRSEAMDNLSDAVIYANPNDSSTIVRNLVAAVRDLLNAEEDLPWKVTDDVDGSVAAFESEQDAREYASECLGDECTITGPTQTVCDDEDEPTESKGCPVRDLLNAEDDKPWKVIDDVDNSVAAFGSEQDACAYASECLGDQCTITGPTQPVYDDEQKQAESKCECDRCRGNQPRTRMYTCPQCGNKRCPKARWHRWKCSNSNEPGQLGVLDRDSSESEHGEQEQTESKGCIGFNGGGRNYCDECIPPDDIPAFAGDPDDCAFRHTPRLVPVTEQIVEVGGKYYRVEP